MRFSKRISALEQKEQRIVYTLGPVSGSYDIEWPENRNAVVSDDERALKIVLKDEFALLTGRVDFTGIPEVGGDGEGLLRFGIPENLRPIGQVVQITWVYDASASLSTMSRFILNNSGDDWDFSIAPTVSMNSFDSGDAVHFHCLYLVK